MESADCAANPETNFTKRGRNTMSRSVKIIHVCANRLNSLQLAVHSSHGARRFSHLGDYEPKRAVNGPFYRRRIRVPNLQFGSQRCSSSEPASIRTKNVVYLEPCSDWNALGWTPRHQMEWLKARIIAIFSAKFQTDCSVKHFPSVNISHPSEDGFDSSVFCGKSQNKARHFRR